jgi:hypothetical protein
MDCPHCGKAFHDAWNDSELPWAENAIPSKGWLGHTTICPACKNATIELSERERSHRPVQAGPAQINVSIIRRFRVYPTNTFRRPTPREIPQEIKEDYEEACAVLPISSKASAALARRCLQAILRGQGYSQRDLAQQIDALLNEQNPVKAIPTALRATVDVIRNFGNFSAHHINDQTTLQVIPVDLGEAEWCLDILDEMFDHYYVKPEQVKARKAELDAKLAAAGKPLSKP